LIKFHPSLIDDDRVLLEVNAGEVGNVDYYASSAIIRERGSIEISRALENTVPWCSYHR
jgi:hypothetical protein